ncbi:nitroreductase [Acinetobacter apis]|uniref:Nitroreductase n=1 Tax=Acinetobacter apis TaxID=1229165 RepID=A0A217EFA6_9GAMM|nr:nitroreductase [Acinetobacter apis]SNQ29188.1 Nitroreductase [Acinetobacter apis]
MTTSSSTHAIDQVIQSRHSVRAFLDQPVHVNMIKEILAVAARAPSGTNTQPWKVYVVTEQKRQDIVQQVCDAQKDINTHPSLSADHQETFAYYPQTWKSPYIDRRRQNGWALYGLLDIQRGEKDKMAAQQLRNFKFFDAPVGLFFTVDQSMGVGAKMDIAMFMQNIMLAAKARGLDTCPQAAWNHFHSIILPLLGADEDEELVCGMALGYADPKAQVNQLETPREAVEDFAHFLAK